MLTVITPTGERPEAFDLCKRMMARQTYAGTVRWIIVDDGRVEQDASFDKPGWTVEVIRPRPFWKPGDNTQGRNLKAALSKLSGGEIVTVWEDDDWYAPGWLEWVAGHAHEAELIGEGFAVYYNVRTRRWQRLHNDEHASLRCSVMRTGAIETFRDVLATPYRYYDMRLWKRHRDSKVFPQALTVGLKGLPGRPGIALGHEGVRGHADPHLDQLRALIGDEAERYAGFYQETPMANEYVVVKAFRYAKRDWKPGDVFECDKRIDAELHLHAKKIARADEVQPKRRGRPRKLTVETQEAKMAGELVEKAPEPEAEPEAEATEAADEPAVEEVEETGQRKPRGRRRFGK